MTAYKRSDGRVRFPVVDADTPLSAAARLHAETGLYVFPCRTRGKEPMIAGGLRSASADPRAVEQWWERTPSANLGLPCEPNGLLILDLDGPAGEATFAELLDGLGPLPRTRTVATARGRHLVFEHPGGATVGKLGEGLDVKGQGYVLAPPSIHPDGAMYAVVDDAQPARLPESWRDAVASGVGRRKAARPPLAAEPLAGCLSCMDVMCAAEAELGWTVARAYATRVDYRRPGEEGKHSLSVYIDADGAQRATMFSTADSGLPPRAYSALQLLVQLAWAGDASRARGDLAHASEEGGLASLPAIARACLHGRDIRAVEGSVAELASVGATEGHGRHQGVSSPDAASRTGSGSGTTVASWTPAWMHDGAVTLPEPPGWATSVIEDADPGDLDAVLGAVRSFVRKYVHLQAPEDYDFVTLFIVHCWAARIAEHTPRLIVTSPDPASGKSRLLQVIKSLVPYPFDTSSSTASALFRTLASSPDTVVLLDECDAIWKAKPDFASEQLRVILNAGYTRTGVVHRNEEVNGRWVPTAFPAFAPAVVAGLDEGNWPDTILSRSYIVRMFKPPRDIQVEPFFERDVRAEVRPLQLAIARVVLCHWEDLWERRAARLGVKDRLEEILRPLAAIADVAGGAWPQALLAVAHRAANVQHIQHDAARPAHDLLRGVRRLWAEGVRSIDVLNPSEYVLSKDLVKWLSATPAAELPGDCLSASGLARLLRPYDVHTRSVAVKLSSGKRTSARGYMWRDLIAAAATIELGDTSSSADGATGATGATCATEGPRAGDTETDGASSIQPLRVPPETHPVLGAGVEPTKVNDVMSAITNQQEVRDV